MTYILSLLLILFLGVIYIWLYKKNKQMTTDVEIKKCSGCNVKGCSLREEDND